LLDELLAEVQPKKGIGSADLIMALQTVAEAKRNAEQKDGIAGLPTGYQSLDKMTKGLAPGDLIILFGDTSHGKSQLSQNITFNLTSNGIPVLFIGLEMTNAQNTQRFLNIGGEDQKGLQALANILYPEKNDLKYETIEAYVEAGTKGGAQLIVIDQLQQLVRSIDNNTAETSLVTHEIKRMAVRYKVPIILISHINRSGSTNGVPTLRELKGSSSIEQDADICLAVWRDIESAPHILQVILRKNRNRGMEFTRTQLYTNGVRLSEEFIV
jgi:replicative DNA helicase